MGHEANTIVEAQDAPVRTSRPDEPGQVTLLWPEDIRERWGKPEETHYDVTDARNVVEIEPDGEKRLVGYALGYSGIALEVGPDETLRSVIASGLADARRRCAAGEDPNGRPTSDGIIIGCYCPLGDIVDPRIDADHRIISLYGGRPRMVALFVATEESGRIAEIALAEAELGHAVIHPLPLDRMGETENGPYHSEAMFARLAEAYMGMADEVLIATPVSEVSEDSREMLYELGRIADGFAEKPVRFTDRGFAAFERK